MEKTPIITLHKYRKAYFIKQYIFDSNNTLWFICICGDCNRYAMEAKERNNQSAFGAEVSRAAVAAVVRLVMQFGGNLTDKSLSKHSFFTTQTSETANNGGCRRTR